MVKLFGESEDYGHLTSEQAELIIAHLGFQNKNEYLLNLEHKLRSSTEFGAIPPIKTVRDLSKVTMGLKLLLDDFLFGEEISSDRGKIREIYSKVYPGEAICFPDARIRLTMKFMDYLFSTENLDSALSN
jgi:hypothetical protein